MKKSAEPKYATRQSNFELLRIVAMAMIVMHHFFYWNKFPLYLQPLGKKRLFIQTFLATEGRVGVDLFFAISIWFLCKPHRQITLHSTAKRAWILERTLLFWSILLGVISLVFKLTPIRASIFIEMFLPLLSYHWWYATIYVLILLLLPMLVKGLSSLTQRQHFALVCIILFMGPFIGDIPGLYNSIINDDILEMLCLLILVCYIRWYHEQLSSVWTGFGCLVLGYLVIGLQDLTAYTAFPQTPFNAIFPKMLNLGILVQAFGWFILFSHLHFHSKIINWTASHVFAIYLITEFVPIRDWLWKSMFDYEPYYRSRIMCALYPIGVVLLVCIVCILLDVVKSVIFKLTVDRNKGHWFELAWNHASEFLNKRNQAARIQNTKTNQNASVKETSQH
ncbi:acyltransferase [Bifidobacterium sp. ESL0790]|uniref:acyltransferase family protein n=1 Tax=Bifidobacterium sp. ESL0790 TaxID=2983233 RepID=UPI0023FA3C7E|nr:acyltransferase [Bifidobacterium sp. ESL0790]WEV72345.1 acyltransferase [Bifidobacterium sp. ESL0790]